MPPEPTSPAPAESPEPEPDLGAEGPRDTPEPAAGAPIPERPIPRGCNPLVFGVVAATIQFAATLYFMRSC
jgi:hypothetical protein